MIRPQNNFHNSPPHPEHKDLVEQFVSLGINCELGIVQRNCKAEPLGLFRFGMTPMRGLIDALRCNFDTISDADQLACRLLRNSEFITTHKRFGFEFHTGMKADAVAEDVMRKKVTVHFSYLARMLMEQLTAGEKIFVFRPLTTDVPEDEAYELSAQMRRFGPTTLLWAAWSADPALVGTVNWRVPGELMVGYLDHYAPLRFAVNASFDGWLAICQGAVALRDAHAAATLAGLGVKPQPPSPKVERYPQPPLSS